MTPDELHDRLSTLADPACKAFGDSLQPGVTDRLGVRMPLVRRVARDVMRTEDVRAFLNAMLAAGGFASQEALMVCVIVAGGAKALELEERLAFVDRLLPHMTGWAPCDLTGSAVKVFRENREELIGYVGESSPRTIPGPCAWRRSGSLSTTATPDGRRRRSTFWEAGRAGRSCLPPRVTTIFRCRLPGASPCSRRRTLRPSARASSLGAQKAALTTPRCAGP